MIRAHLGDLPRFLEITFVLENNSKKKFKQTAVLILFFMMILTYASSMYILGLEKSLEGAAYFFAVCLIKFCQYILFYFRQSEVKQLLNIFERAQKLHKETWEKEMFKRDSKQIWNFIYKYWLILLLYLIFYYTLPTVVDFIIGNIFPNTSSFNVQMPCEGILNWFEPRSIERFALSIIIIMWCYAVGIIHIGMQAIILVSIMYTKIELKMVRHKLLLLKNVLNQNENNKQDIIKKMLIDVISHHQITLEILHTLRNTLSLPFAIENTAISICLCLSLYNITVVDRGNLSSTANGIGSSISHGFILCVVCFFGESLEEENNEIFNSIYDLPWYYQNRNFRKVLVLMMRQAQKPFVINYHLLGNLNLPTFMQVVNTSYSYFMMLQSTV